MKKKRRISLLLPLGLLLLAGALAGLLSVPSVTQYVFLPGDRKPAELVQGLQSMEKELGDAYTGLTLYASQAGAVLSVNGGTSEDSVTLYRTAPRYFELCPRAFRSGRPLSRGDSADQARVIVLDDDLGFRLFGSVDPLGKTVTLNSLNYEVVGIAEHDRRIGETGSYAAWVPLEAEESFTADLITVSASGGESVSLRTIFESAAKNSFGGGNLFILSREKVRGTMVLRILLLFLFVWTAALFAGLYGRLLKRFVRTAREKLKSRYALHLLPWFTLRIAGFLLFLAAAVGAGYLAVRFFAQPITLLPEWVPDDPSSLTSIVDRFWTLTASSAAPVRLLTPEMAEIRFWSALVRWGVILALAGVLMTVLIRWRSRKLAPEKEDTGEPD